MLIEDDESVRRFVQRVLESRGYVVHAVPTPGEAIDFARTGAASIDVVVTDVILPDMSGPALASELRADRPSLKVLLMSGYSDGALAHRQLLTPDMAFLQKPFSAQGLLAKVRELLDDASGPLDSALTGGSHA